MRRISSRAGWLSAVTVLAAGCSAPERPVLYPNQMLQNVGPEIAQADIDDCLRRAEQYGVPSETNVVGDAAEQSATGAAVGAATGAVVGDAGRGAGVGAAAGASHGLVSGLFRSQDPDPLVRRFVEECLRDKGYRVIGWR